MGIATCELVVTRSEDKVYTYKATVENGLAGFIRLNVACEKLYNDDEISSQGIDLSPSECRALAKMLNAAADLIA